jgi:hypothetical protein
MSRYALADKYEWIEIYRTNETDEEGEFYGHTYFRDGYSGKVSICDMSGDYPHMSDDGVLWVNRDAPVQIFLEEESGRLWARIPVIKQRDIDRNDPNPKTFCSDPVMDAIAVAKMLDMRIEVHGILAKMIEALTPKITPPETPVTLIP